MKRISKLEAESYRLSGFSVKRTKHKYYLLGSKVKVMTGYVDYL